MAPDYNEGDVVIIDPNIKPVPGDLVFVEMGDGETKLFRKYRPQNTHKTTAKIYDLVPVNPDWPTIRIGTDTNKGRIKGVMTERITRRRAAG